MKAAISMFLFLIICACSQSPSAGDVQTAIVLTRDALPTGTPVNVPVSNLVATFPRQPTATLKDTLAATNTPAPSLTPTTFFVESTNTPTLSWIQKIDHIPWDEAADHIGEELTVCGTVAGGHYADSTNGQPTFLNIGKDYPEPDRFAVLIWGQDRRYFPPNPEEYYSNKMICVTGKISIYQGLVEMVISEADQLLTP